MPNPDELADAIEATRAANKNLWQNLADVLGCDFKPERRHNDIIIQMLRLAGKRNNDPLIQTMLLAISANDRKISDLVAKLADEHDA